MEWQLGRIWGWRHLGFSLLLMLVSNLSSSSGITDSHDRTALLAFNREVMKSTGKGIPGWFPSSTSDPCGDTCADPAVPPFLGVLCPLPSSCSQTAPLRVLSLVLYETGIRATNIAPITALNALTTILLQGNKLSGVIPSGLASLRSLQNLDLSANQFTGSIPDLSGAPLATLVLANQTWGGNHGLNGTIPASLSRMTLLSQLDLSHNSLSGSIPAGILKLPRLNSLILRYNSLTGKIPSLAPAIEVQTMDISHNPYSRQPIPKEFNNLTLLNGVLDLSYMNLIGSLVDLRNLGAITDVILDGNSLSGSFDPKMLPWGSLGYISIKNNGFVGTISPYLYNVLNYNIYCMTSCGINFANNRFIGALPSILGNLLQAFVFDFSENELTGMVPNRYGYIYSMLQLKLQGNRLSGPLPDFNPPADVTYQLMLAQLDLSRNTFRGSIPSALSRFTRLMRMDVSNNRLYGTIPTSLSALSHLSYLNLSSNLLSGRLPAFAAASSLDVSRNYFGGLFGSFSAQYKPGVQLRASLNCFQCHRLRACIMPRQWPRSQCKTFCRADKLEIPCGARKVCSVWPGQMKPSCTVNV